ncbi:XylR N-terminal domain-containing protein [Caryophanon latum]|uniref:4-vinyl reductase 4VR domain-containing protein n=1 Tax=Caryophanon latum TaxID=33977 RepID=A0A1C0YTX3_9BACL|nr:XylR N-terminal domain-containing protein [Caryophanon latum]OCS90628.1 hypothetical protein A6K76_10795 [Caryophanon latum]
MKANKLVFEHVVDVSPRSGVIKLNNKRMVLTATESFGFLRKDLVQTLGMERAKTIFIRYGISSGYNAAKAVMNEFPWRTKEQLILAGPALHTLAGTVMVEAEQMDLQENSLYMRGSWHYSYEYEEHVKHIGFNEEPVCWELLGYVKGYLRAVYGKDIVVYEECCRGKKDAHCIFVACSPHLAPREHLNELSYFDTDCLVSRFDDMYQQMEEQHTIVERADELQEKLMQVLLKEQGLEAMLQLICDELEVSAIAERSMIRRPFEQVFYEASHKALYEQYARGEAVDAHMETLHIKSNQLAYAKLVLLSDAPIVPYKKKIVQRSLTTFIWYFNMTLRNLKHHWQQQAEAFELLLQQQKIEQFDNSLFTVNFHEPFRVVVLKSNATDLYEQYLCLEKHVNDVFMLNGDIVLLVQEPTHQKGKLAQACVKDFMKAFPKSKGYFGVGRVVTNIENIQTSYEEAMKLSNFLVHCSNKRVQVVTYEKLQHVLLFLKTTDPSQLVSYYEEIIGALIAYDVKQDTQLLQTLQAYFENNGNLNKTAHQLNLSLPGLRYRMDKIESLIHVDVKSGDGRFQCQLALQFYYAVQAISE